MGKTAPRQRRPPRPRRARGLRRRGSRHTRRILLLRGRHGDAYPLARILAAPGQRPVVRLNNGRYLHDGNRDLPAHLLRTDGQRLALPPDADALLLDEPDTYPHNRYSVSAANFHLHVSLGLLSGCGGAKLWLSRTRAWEAASGEAYRRVFKHHTGFYRELLRLSEGMFPKA